MKIDAVELSLENSNIFTFGLSNVNPTDKYFAKAIVGLDADDLIRKFYGFSRVSRSKFYNFSIAKREIAARIVLNPDHTTDESFSDIRDELLRAISASRTGIIDIIFTGGGGAIAHLASYITKLEVPYFSETSELQITFRCDDPMLRGFNPIVYQPDDLGTSNPILIVDKPSTAPHGFTFAVDFTATSPQLTIQDLASSPEWIFEVTPSGGFLVGDELHFSSEFGNKSVHIDRGGTIIPLMDRITPGSVWPTIFPGSNQFHFLEIDDFDWMHLTHYPAYWGV